MNPRLLAVSGKVKGTVFAVTGREITIGRDTANNVHLDDRSVSRSHCQVKRGKDGRFFIHDLKSFNGVFVNGTPVSRHEIKHGDQIGVGDIVMFFLIEESEREAAFHEGGLSIVDDSPLNEQSTIRLARKDALYLSPEMLVVELPEFARVTRDLSALLHIASALNSIDNLEDLQLRLLDLIVEIIPAQRAAILLVDEYDRESVSHFVWSSQPKDEGNISVSRTVIDHCLSEQVSVLCNNVSQDETLYLAESLAASGVQTMLCVPITIGERNLGVIYLDTSDTSMAFDEHHLQLLTGIAAIAARPLENAKYIQSLRSENQRLLDQLDDNYRIIGESRPMKEIFSLIARIAPTDSTVLVLGESGTGKELVAHSIHQNSPRKNRPFVAINCATLTDNLLESELFGHERGAFTGAVTSKIGQFEIAEGGTIFLDEVGELPIRLQAKLLRVLQEREVIRLGGLRPKKIDVRVIAATNRKLEELIRNGGFREDLFFRLNVISLTMPPLRVRGDDIQLLTRYFIHKHSGKCKRNIKGISPEARSYMQRYDWPGNVRELENAIERAVILTLEETLTAADLPEAIVRRTDEGAHPEHADAEMSTFQAAVLTAKKQIIQNALSASNGRITEAAKTLAVHPNNLHRLIKKLGLRAEQE